MGEPPELPFAFASCTTLVLMAPLPHTPHFSTGGALYSGLDRARTLRVSLAKTADAPRLSIHPKYFSPVFLLSFINSVEVLS